MKTEHTEGNWSVGECEEHPKLHTIWAEKPSGLPILIARTCFGPNSEANAQLIVAAPDLFAALLDIIASADANDSRGIHEAIEASRTAVARTIKGKQ